MRQYGLTCRGESYRATRSVEQLLTEFSFQPLDLGADRRLGNMNALGCPGEVALLGDCDEVLQLTKFHKQ